MAIAVIITTACVLTQAGSGKYGGYDYVASSSSFGDATYTGCGGMQDVKTIRLQTGFIPIATSQASMEPFNNRGCGYANCHDAITNENCNPDRISCFDDNSKPIEACDVNSCKCDQVSDCYCGRGTMASTTGPTAPLGCYKCARGQFLTSIGTAGYSPFPQYSISSNCSGTNYSSFINETVYNFVVVDSCPYGNNPKWCPYRPGQTNQCGFHNHFDIAMRLDELQSIYNVYFNYVAFSLMECPQKVLDLMKKQLAQPQYCPIE